MNPATPVSAASTKAPRSFLLTWGDFEQTPDSEIAAIAAKLRTSASVTEQWSSGNRRDIAAGEQVFLLRQGNESPGIVGRGIVNRGSFDADHWDPERRAQGAKAWYVMVDWYEMLPKGGVLSRDELLRHGFPKSLLNAQASGVAIPEKAVESVRQLWVAHYEEAQSRREHGNRANPQGSGVPRLARIAYNTAEWRYPTGSAGDQETCGTYNAQNRFGHEEWLFRDWMLGEWRYGFIQGLNNSRKKYLGQLLDITLYTIQPDGRRRLVATIYGLESLTDDQAADALAGFKRKGRLKVMQDEVRAIGGNAEALGDPKWAENVLNVRFRMENVEFFSPESYLPDDDWIKKRHRYMLYAFDRSEQERVEKMFRGRRGTTDAPVQRRLFRRGTKPLECSPEHDKMQATLMAELQKEFGAEHVVREQDFVDVQVETEKALLFFEIKTDLDPRTVIRQALGQILEYAFHPARTGPRPSELVIVGRTPLAKDDEAYIQRLREEFKLPLSYRVVSI